MQLVHGFFYKLKLNSYQDMRGYKHHQCVTEKFIAFEQIDQAFPLSRNKEPHFL